MAIETDVLVIGGGLAGRMAALAASDAGADVRLLSASSSSLRQASGLIDVLGYRDGEGPLSDPFEVLPTGGDHPYAAVGDGSLREGLALFDDATGDLYRGAHTDRNALVPTAGGRLKPTARYPRGMAPGLASDDRNCLLVGFESHTGFDAPLAADRLQYAGVPFEVRGVTVDFPLDLRADAGPMRYARALGRDEDGVRTVLAQLIGASLDGESRVGLPAVLGVDVPAEVRSDLSTHLDVDVFEVPPGPPSVPGRRLESTLDAALDDAGVRTETGVRVVGFEDDRGRIDRVFADADRRVPHAAAEYVLATGGLVGEGVETDREAVREPVFDCHVPHPGSRDEWYEEAAFGEHAFARFGVRIDEGCRPLDASGEPDFANLRAAGAVIGGTDAAAEKSGSGISIATGFRAGSEAGKAAVHGVVTDRE